MKHRLLKPLVAVYNAQEVADMVGPAQTQYCGCYDPEHPPQWKEFDSGRSLTISVDASDACESVDGIETVRIDFIDGDSLYSRHEFTPGDGTFDSPRWEVIIDDFNLAGPPGKRYDVQVSFMVTGTVQGVICESTITVDPAQL